MRRDWTNPNPRRHPSQSQSPRRPEPGAALPRTPRFRWLPSRAVEHASSLRRIHDAAGEEDRTGGVVTNEEEEGAINHESNGPDTQGVQHDGGRSRGRGALLVDLDIGLMEHIRNGKIARSVDPREVGALAEGSRHPHR